MQDAAIQGRPQLYASIYNQAFQEADKDKVFSEKILSFIHRTDRYALEILGTKDTTLPIIPSTLVFPTFYKEIESNIPYYAKYDLNSARSSENKWYWRNYFLDHIEALGVNPHVKQMTDLLDVSNNFLYERKKDALIKMALVISLAVLVPITAIATAASLQTLAIASGIPLAMIFTASLVRTTTRIIKGTPEYHLAREIHEKCEALRDIKKPLVASLEQGVVVWK